MGKLNSRIEGGGIIFGDYIMESLVGNILEIVEAIGLKDKQESSVKSMIKDKIYGMGQYAVWVTPDLLEKINQAQDKRVKSGEVTQVDTEDIK